MNKFRAYYFLVDFNIGILLVYLPVVLRGYNNINESTIGKLFFIGGIVAIIGALINGIIAQKINDERRILQLGIMFLLLGAILLINATTYHLILLSFILIFFIRSTLNIIGDEVIINFIMINKVGDFGKIRSFGSIGWASNFFINGFIITNYPDKFYLVWITAIVALLIVAFIMPKVIVPHDQLEFKLKDLTKLWNNKNIVYFFIISGLLWGTIINMQTYSQFFLTDLGGSLQTYAWINGFIGIVDFIIMANSTKIKNKAGESYYLKGLILLMVVKYLIIAIALSPIFIYISILIDPVFFGLFVPFSSVFIKREVNFDLSAMALTITNVINMVMAAIFSIIFGYMYEFISPMSVFITMACICLMAFGFTFKIKSFNNKKIPKVN